MKWEFRKRTEVLCTIDEAPGSISIQSEKCKGLKVDIQRQEVTTGERILGVKLALEGGVMMNIILDCSRQKLWQGRLETPR